MRNKLKGLSQSHRYTFRARVGLFETKLAEPVEIFLTPITVDGKEVAEHLWFTYGKWSRELKPGDWIEFDARVKGYQDDCKLVFPTRVRVLSGESSAALMGLSSIPPAPPGSES